MPDLIEPLVIPGLFLLLQLTGLLLALAFWRRCPAACALLSAASLISMLGSLTQVGAHFVGMGNLPFLDFFSLLQWIAYGLMLVAIFADRNQPPRLPQRSLPPDDDWEPAAKSTTASSDNLGIQQHKPQDRG